VITFTSTTDLPPDTGVLGVPVFSGLTTPDGAGARLDRKFLAASGFDGAVGQCQRLLSDDGSVIVAVGVGDPARVDADVLRKAGAAFARAATPGTARTGAVTLTAARGRLAAGVATQSVVEGIGLAAYRFAAHKSNHKSNGKATPALETVAVVGGDRTALRRGQTVTTAIANARDWINEPPKVMTPRKLAEIAEDLAFREKLDVDVWDEERIQAERLGGLLGVAAGSAEPPRLIRLAYNPPRARKTVALVGKGITFDSGGLSLKTSEGMRMMKSDMGGAAAVLATMGALPQTGSPVGVIAYLCCTENMPSGTAIHIGDVLTARNGTTIEVLNTDAEGRLVLADGLSLAAEAGPDAIIDIATLTGAQKVSLGTDVAGLLSNHDGLAGQVLEAAWRAGEPAWRLPLWSSYRRHLDSDVADLKNIGLPNNAGAIVAALFLHEFSGGRPWAHLDIAGPSWSDSDEGWHTKGGTGWGVGTFIELLRQYEPLSRPR
jgi:leucyl aminopeptidase